MVISLPRTWTSLANTRSTSRRISSRPTEQGDHRLVGRDDDLADDAVDVRRRDGGVGHVVGRRPFACSRPRSRWTSRG